MNSMADNDSTTRIEAPAGGRLVGQVAVITGAAQGIGRAIARAFAADGARVVIADLAIDQARDVEQAVTEAGGTGLAWKVAMADPESVAALFARVTEVFGRVDLLVNNAGICPVTAFPNVDLAAWRRVFTVNLEGPLIATQIAAAIMKEQEPHPISGRRGKIINVSSPAAEIGRPLFAAYGASKAALNHLTKTTAAVLGPSLISAVVLYPGSVMGPLWEALIDDLVAADGRDRDLILAERMAGMPRGRFQFPEEVAAMALYMAAFPGMALNGRVLWSEPHVADL